MNDNLKGKFDYTARVLDRTDLCDLSDDYTLPDYMPAIGRVISCTGVAAPPALYIGGGNIELAGGVRYLLHYESAEDSTLWCAELPAEYDHIIPIDRIATSSIDPEKIFGITKATAESIGTRITAPRRLNIKSRIRLPIALSATAHFETAFHGDTEDTDAICYLEGASPYGMLSCGSSAPIICRDKVSFYELGLTDSETCRIISSRAKVMITRTDVVGNTLECKGEVNANMLYILEEENERPRRIARRIPFSAEIPLQNIPAAASNPIGIRAYGVCPTITTNSGEDGISLEVAILISGETLWISSISYLKDVYSQKADCELSRTNTELRIPIACFNGNATVSAQNKLDTLGLDGDIKLLDYGACVLPDAEWELKENGKLIISGKMKINMIADNGSELIPAEFESDFKYVTEIHNSDALLSPNLNIIADVSDIKCRLDGERIYADCEISVSVLAEDERKIATVSEVYLTESTAASEIRSAIIVCYPAKGETLWDVAKRYRADARDIAERNSLSAVSPDAADSLAKSKFLIL